MEFLAATKDGIIVYNALSAGNKPDWDDDRSGDWSNGKTADGNFLDVVAKIPSTSNAFGHCWSQDGSVLASVSSEGDSAVLYDADAGYQKWKEVAKVAPDVEGRVGGIRSIRLSPKVSHLVTYEKWDPAYPQNCHVWCIQENAPKKVHSCCLSGYTSGALDKELVKW